MVKEAQIAGAIIKTDCEVIEISRNYLTLRDNKKIGFNYLIGADGSNSVVRKFLNLKIEKEAIAFHYKIPKVYQDMELFFNAKYFGSGYAWIFPHKDFTSIGCGADPNFLIDGEQLKNNFEKWLRIKNIDTSNAKFESWTINYDYRGYQFDKIFLVGDAGGLTSGLTGEGIFNAMISGQEIAHIIIDPQYNPTYLKKIIKTKQNQERLLNFLSQNKYLTQFCYGFGGLFFKTGLLNKKLISSFG